MTEVWKTCHLFHEKDMKTFNRKAVETASLQKGLKIWQDSQALISHKACTVLKKNTAGLNKLIHTHTHKKKKVLSKHSVQIC